MRVRTSALVFIGSISLSIALICQPLLACLRSTLDDRAVEWSTLIVIAKLSSVGKPTPLITPTSRPSDKSISSNNFQLFDFEVTSTLDGASKPGDHVSVVRFSSGSDAGNSSICHQLLAESQIGKSFLVLLRPEKDLAWGGGFDPRTSQVHDINAFMIVYLESMDDIGSDGLDDAKYTISSTRAVEAQFSADDARTQAEAVINAADDTEQSQAEQALLDMGPKALPVLKDEMGKAGEVEKERLRKVIDAVSPPSILWAMKQN
jgi:hypothetical protein